MPSKPNRTRKLVPDAFVVPAPDAQKIAYFQAQITKLADEIAVVAPENKRLKDDLARVTAQRDGLEKELQDVRASLVYVRERRAEENVEKGVQSDMIERLERALVRQALLAAEKTNDYDDLNLSNEKARAKEFVKNRHAAGRDAKHDAFPFNEEVSA